MREVVSSQLPGVCHGFSLRFPLTIIAAGFFRENKAGVLLQLSGQRDGIIWGEEALLPVGVVVEGPTVVPVLPVALVPARLDVGHVGEVGVGEGEVVAGHVDVLAVGRQDGALVLQVESSPGGGPEAGRGRPPGLLGEFAGLEVCVVGGRPADVGAGLDTELSAARDVLHILSLSNRKWVLWSSFKANLSPPH